MKPAASPPASGPAVAVVDLGSNSIKLLVATREPATGGLRELAQRTEETRLGTGITENPPRLHDDAMTRAVASVQALLALAAPFAPAAVQLVATSAVRDAVNREAFMAKLRAATGHELRVIAGAEEARLIGRGIGCDPALHKAGAFYLFDLGGGSLEMLAFRDGAVAQLTSLPLGCVRVTERCVADPAQPLSEGEIAAVRALTRGTIAASGFRFDLPDPARAVATGGTATTFRAVAAAGAGRGFLEFGSALKLPDWEALARRVCAQTIAQRRALAGLPAARADVFPAALLTLAEVARVAQVEGFVHSLLSLRHGLADEWLSAHPAA